MWNVDNVGVNPNLLPHREFITGDPRKRGEFMDSQASKRNDFRNSPSAGLNDDNQSIEFIDFKIVGIKNRNLNSVVLEIRDCEIIFRYLMRCKRRDILKICIICETRHCIKFEMESGILLSQALWHLSVKCNILLGFIRFANGKINTRSQKFLKFRFTKTREICEFEDLRNSMLDTDDLCRSGNL